MGNMKKRVVTGMIALFVLSAMVLSACGSKEEPAQPAASGSASGSGAVVPVASGSSSAEPVGPIAGGWTVNEEIVTPVLTEESQKAFDTAIKTYTGMDLEPAALLATQVVAGTNYLYLCKGKMVVPDAEPVWCLVVVYEDLQGNAEITSVEELDMTALKTTEEAADKDIVGGWTILAPSNAITLPKDVSDAFGKATEQYTGVTLSPLALLATQVVAGANYKILCQGTTATAEPEDAIYVATMYVDLDGNAELTDVQKLDLLAYLK